MHLGRQRHRQVEYSEGSKQTDLISRSWGRGSGESAMNFTRSRSKSRRCRHLNKTSKIAYMYLKRHRYTPSEEPPREVIASPQPKGPQRERPCPPCPAGLRARCRWLASSPPPQPPPPAGRCPSRRQHRPGWCRRSWRRGCCGRRSGAARRGGEGVGKLGLGCSLRCGGSRKGHT